MARFRVKEVLTGLEGRIKQDNPNNYIAVVYVEDYFNDLKKAKEKDIKEENVFLAFDVVGPGATTREVVDALEKREANGYSVHELKGKPTGVNILTPFGFRHKVLGI